MTMFTELSKEEMLNEVEAVVSKFDQKVIKLDQKDKATKQDLYKVVNSDGGNVYGATPSTIENLHFNKVILSSY